MLWGGGVCVRVCMWVQDAQGSQRWARIQRTSPCANLQVCTGVMLHGYPLVKRLCGGLQAFMQQHSFNSIAEFKGAR